MAIAIYVKTKSARLKSIIRAALPIGVLACEPLIYGVSLPLFYPSSPPASAAARRRLRGLRHPGDGRVRRRRAGTVGRADDGRHHQRAVALVRRGPSIAYVMGFVLTYFFGFKEHMVERLS
jgi:PTS system sucrose-specific IIC component